MIKQIIKAHKFFFRKSQHYIMGDWNSYQEWFPAELGYSFNKKKWRYVTGFIPAYIKFMWFSIKDHSELDQDTPKE